MEWGVDIKIYIVISSKPPLVYTIFEKRIFRGDWYFQGNTKTKISGNFANMEYLPSKIKDILLSYHFHNL